MEVSRQPPCLFPGHCGSVKQDNKRYFILYLQLASCVARHNEAERIQLNRKRIRVFLLAVKISRNAKPRSLADTK